MILSCILVVFTRAGEGEFHEGVLCGGGEEVRVVQTQGFQECELYCNQDGRRHNRVYQAIAWEHNLLSNWNDCICWTHCECTSPNRQYEMYMEPGNVWPDKQCPEPMEFAYPTDACQYLDLALKKDYPGQKLYGRYECAIHRRSVLLHAYPTRHDCYTEVNKLDVYPYPMGECFEDYPGEYISVHDCYDGGINFTRCNDVSPSAAPTIEFDCDSCTTQFEQAGGCTYVISDYDDGGLLTGDCKFCAIPVFRYCFAQTTPIPTGAPVPTVQPSENPSYNQTNKLIYIIGQGPPKNDEKSTKNTPMWVWIVLACAIVFLCCAICILIMYKRKGDDHHEELLLHDAVTTHYQEDIGGKFLTLIFPYPDLNIRKLRPIQKHIMSAYRNALTGFFKDSSRRLRLEAQESKMKMAMRKKSEGAEIELKIGYKNPEFKAMLQEEENHFYMLVEDELDDRQITRFMAENKIDDLPSPGLNGVDSMRSFDYQLVRTKTGRLGTLLHEDEHEGMIMYEDGEAPEVRRADSYYKDNHLVSENSFE